MCCKSGGGLSRQNVYGSGGRRLIPCDNTVIKPLLSCVHRIDFLDSVVSGHKSDGRKILYYTSRYERNRKNRDAAIKAHGLICQCCGFDFYAKYGEIGKNFILSYNASGLQSTAGEVGSGHLAIKWDNACSVDIRILHPRSFFKFTLIRTTTYKRAPIYAI